MNQTSKFSVRDICYAGLFAAVIAGVYVTVQAAETE